MYATTVHIIMPTETTYTQARANFAALIDEALDTREPVIIRRRGREDVVLIAAAELRSLMETVHILRSPANAKRFFRALKRAEEGRGRPESIESLRRSIGLDEK